MSQYSQRLPDYPTIRWGISYGKADALQQITRFLRQTSEASKGEPTITIRILYSGHGVDDKQFRIHQSFDRPPVYYPVVGNHGWLFLDGTVLTFDNLNEVFQTTPESLKCDIHLFANTCHGYSWAKNVC